MDNQGSEIHDWDWEVVPSNNIPNQVDGEGHKSPSSPPSDDGVIRSDYFSLDYAATAANDAADNTSAEVVFGSDEGEGGESDNPSWVDPSGSSVVGGSRKSRSPNSSSSSDFSDRYLMSLMQPHSDCGGGFECEDHQGLSSFEHLGVSEDAPQVEFHDAIGEDKGDEQREEQQGVMDNQLSQPNLEEVEEKKDEKKRVVWWKVPFEVVKYCVLRVNPVWSLSMAAAALMGFVLLRRRYLYKMKRKTQGIKLNVTVDDKKVSQFMSRAARLNEAFSVVKRVPIIRPALPAPGMAPWPVMSLR